MTPNQSSRIPSPGARPPGISEGGIIGASWALRYEAKPTPRGHRIWTVSGVFVVLSEAKDLAVVVTAMMPQ
jgi:hypothetical protein